MQRFITKLLGPHTERIYALLRMVAGFMFVFHGVQKIFGLFTDATPPVASQKWIGGILELTLGALVAVGAFTRVAAFFASGMMAVAYFQFHWKLQLGERILPIVNRGELAVLYCFVFLFIAARGAGVWSVDGRR